MNNVKKEEITSKKDKKIASTLSRWLEVASDNNLPEEIRIKAAEQIAETISDNDILFYIRRIYKNYLIVNSKQRTLDTSTEIDLLEASRNIIIEYCQSLDSKKIVKLEEKELFTKFRSNAIGRITGNTRRYIEGEMNISKHHANMLAYIYKEDKDINILDTSKTKELIKILENFQFKNNVPIKNLGHSVYTLRRCINSKNFSILLEYIDVELDQLGQINYKKFENYFTKWIHSAKEEELKDFGIKAEKDIPIYDNYFLSTTYEPRRTAENTAKKKTIIPENRKKIIKAAIKSKLSEFIAQQ